MSITTLKIKVTDKCLTGGVCTSETRCAISLAIRDVFPLSRVDGTLIKIYANKYRRTVGGESMYDHPIYSIPLPASARVFIANFDSCNSREEKLAMGTLEFEIGVPEGLINAINIDEIKALLQDHPTLEIVEV